MHYDISNCKYAQHVETTLDKHVHLLDRVVVQSDVYLLTLALIRVGCKKTKQTHDELTKNGICGDLINLSNRLLNESDIKSYKIFPNVTI